MTIAPDDERLKRVHFGSYVFDYSPTGGPFVMTPRHRKAMLKAIGEGKTVGRIIRAMMADQLLELKSDDAARRDVEDLWARSGVNGVQITLGGLELNPSAWESVLRDAAYWHRRARTGDDLAICLDAEGLLAAAAAGKTGVMLGTQDAAWIDDELLRLEILYDLGLRVVQLTYNNRNLLGDGCTERQQSGLSHFGLRVVKELNRFGIVVDVSHSGAGVTMDAIEASEAPVAITHSCCAAVAEHPRAKSDSVLRALAERQGYFGIVAVPFFIKPKGGATLDDMLDHLEHAVKTVGIDKVGIATDWGGWTPDMPTELSELSRAAFAPLGFRKADMPVWGVSIPEFEKWESWPNLTAGLMRRGFDDQEIAGLIGGNWLQFLRRVGL
jgi:membrane dipeptidase